MRMYRIALITAACFTLAAQQRPVVVERPLQGPAGPKGEVGPHIGDPAPPIDALDQFGKRQTLQTICGPKGAIIVFQLSADT